MRTVTFSDARVGETFSDDFVWTWENRVGDFHDCDPSTEQDIFGRHAEAYTTRNICTFFLTPDLQVLHYIAGYYAPQLFIEEAAFALELQQALFDADGRPRTGAPTLFKEMHARRAAQLKEVTEWLGREENQGEIEEMFGDPLWDLQYDAQSHVHCRHCAARLARAHGYIARVHEDFAEERKGIDKAHAREEGVLGPPLSPLMIEDVADHRLRVKRKLAVVPLRAGRQPFKERRIVRTIPLLSELVRNYRFGIAFAEEDTRKPVKNRTR